MHRDLATIWLSGRYRQTLTCSVLVLVLVAFSSPGDAGTVTLTPGGDLSGFLQMEVGPFGAGIAVLASLSTPNGDSLWLRAFNVFNNLAGPTSTGGSLWPLHDFADGSFAIAGHSHFAPYCGVHFPGQPFFPCNVVGAGVSMFAAPPPYDGHPVVTVTGTYGAQLGVGEVVDLDGFGFGSVSSNVAFVGSGPATLTFSWHPEFGNGIWLFESGRVEFHPTPEPTTLILLATTAAGLGLTRWRHRHKAAHTA